jgi:hypothetical protein
VVFADCGRFDPRSPAAALLQHAALTLLVLRPTVEGAEHARVRAAVLRHVTRQPGLIVVGEHPYPAREVAAAVGIPLVGVVAEDRAGVAALTGAAGRRLDRSALVRSARVVAERLTPVLEGPEAQRHEARGNQPAREEVRA